MQTVHAAYANQRHFGHKTDIYFLKLIGGKCCKYDGVWSTVSVYGLMAVVYVHIVCHAKGRRYAHDGIGSVTIQWQINAANIFILDINRRAPSAMYVEWCASARAMPSH